MSEKYDDECYGDNWDVYVLKYSKYRPDDNMKAILDNLMNNWIRDDYLAHYTLRDNADGETMDTYIVSLRIFKMSPERRSLIEKNLNAFDIDWELNPDNPYNAWILKGDVDPKRDHLWCKRMHRLSKLAADINAGYDPGFRMEFTHLFVNNCFFHEDIQTKYSDKFGKVIIGPIYCDILNGYNTHPGVYYHNYNDKYEKIVEKYLKLKEEENKNMVVFVREYSDSCPRCRLECNQSWAANKNKPLCDRCKEEVKNGG